MKYRFSDLLVTVISALHAHYTIAMQTEKNYFLVFGLNLA